jgi:ubiquinone/menaquinone biosynthesis C-methylase UbiE
MMTVDDRTHQTQATAPVCPACLGDLAIEPGGRRCADCERWYPDVAGLSDLRLESDRYLDLKSERDKAERLHAIESTTDVMGLSEAYYAMCDDIAERCHRFLQHIAHAEARGAALAERLPPNGRILEVGCGTGGLLVASTRAGKAIEGVDIASRWLIAARRRLSDHGLSVPLLAASAERLPYPDDRFDAVVADSLLEHLDDPECALREWARVLRPGGRLIVWSPNRYTLTTDPHIGLWGLGWLPRGWVPAYLRLRGREFWPPRTLSTREVRDLAVRAGLVSVSVEPPAIPARWAWTRPALQRLAIGVYAKARCIPLARGLLQTIGPLWELQAVKKGAA